MADDSKPSPWVWGEEEENPASDTKPKSSVEQQEQIGTPLPNEKQELFCQYVVAGLSYVDAYAKAGYKSKHANSNSSRLAAQDSVRLRIEQLKSPIDKRVQAAVAQMTDHDVQTRVGRVLELIDLRARLRKVIAERAAFATHQDVPGGSTGMVVTRIKQIGKGKDSREVKEHEVDVALSREIREISKQIAMELGQWVEKSDQTRRLASIEDLPDEALAAAIEKGRRLKAQREKERKPN